MAYTEPPTFSAGAILTAAQLNTYLRDNFKAISDAWATYTPTWTASVTNPTLGNGTLTGRRIVVGKLLLFDIELTIGSTTAVGSGTYSFTIGGTARSSFRKGLGELCCFDTSAATVRLGVVDLFTTTTCSAFTFTDTRLNNAAPFTWATGDTISLSGIVETA